MSLSPTTGAGFVAEIHPIGSRVYVTEFAVHGQVRSWQMFRGFVFYVVHTDRGRDVLTVNEGLERARPRVGWRPVVVS